MSSASRYLMCRPTYFDVCYVINPWMEANVNCLDAEKARRQWQSLYEAVARHCDVELVDPQPGLPDMTFTANAGVVRGDRAVVSRFLCAERAGEEEHFENWFRARGFRVYKTPVGVPFEGAGDCVWDQAGGWLWAGHGFRSAREAHGYLAEWLDAEVVSLRLVDGRFYHLDTCFCSLKGGYLVYYPPAFDAPSLAQIESRVPKEKRIPVGERDAARLACNIVNIDDAVILNCVSPELEARLRGAGFDVTQVDMSEFLRSGGSARCLTLRVADCVAKGAGRPPAVAVQSHAQAV